MRISPSGLIKIRRFIGQVNYHQALLILIIIIGALLRFIYTTRYMEFSMDNGRDILAAKHIVDFREWTLASPGSAADLHLKNSPLYFYLLALLWFFAPSVEGVVFLFALAGTLLVLLSYVIGKDIGGKNTGLATAWFVAISDPLIMASRSIWQPNLIPLLVLGTIFFLYQFFKLAKVHWLILAILSYFLALHLHFAVLLLLPWFILVSSYISWMNINKKKISLKVLLGIGAMGVSLFLTWLILTSRVQVLNHWNFLLMNLKTDQTEVMPYIGRLSQIITVISTSLFPRVPRVFGFLLLGLIYVGLGYVLTKQKYKSNDWLITAALAGFLLSLGVGLFYKDELVSWYFQSFYPVLLLGLAYLFTHPLLLKWKVIQVYLIIIISLWLNKGYDWHLRNSRRYEYDFAKTISKAIIDNNQVFSNNFQFNYDLVVNAYEPNWWDSTPFWYFLETYYRKQLTKISLVSQDLNINNGAAFEPLYSFPNTTYLICPKYPLWIDIRQDCLEAFLKEGSGKRNVYVVVEIPEEVFRSVVYRVTKAD